MRRGLATLAFFVGVIAWGAPSIAVADVTCPGSLGPTFINDNLIVSPGTTCRLDRTTVRQNIKVGANARLFARGITVTDGNIEALYGGSVVDIRGARGRCDGIPDSNPTVVKKGNIQTIGARSVFLCWVTVQSDVGGGNIQLKGTTPCFEYDDHVIVKEDKQIEESVVLAGATGCNYGLPDLPPPGTIITGNSRIGENLQLYKNRAGRYNSVHFSSIGEDLQFFENSSTQYNEIVGNTVREDLQVFKNTAGSNIVSSNTLFVGNLQCKENTAQATGGGNSAPKKEDECAGL